MTETVQALAKKQDARGVQEALAALAQGQTQAAKAIFAKTVEAKTVEGAAADREAAEAARHLGALAFLDNTEEALRWVRRAVELDPANVNGWNPIAWWSMGSIPPPRECRYSLPCAPPSRSSSMPYSRGSSSA